MLVYHNSEICSIKSSFTDSKNKQPNSRKSDTPAAVVVVDSNSTNKKHKNKHKHKKHRIDIRESSEFWKKKPLDIRDFYKRKPRRQSAVFVPDLLREKDQKKKSTKHSKKAKGTTTSKKNLQYLQGIGLKVKQTLGC